LHGWEIKYTTNNLPKSDLTKIYTIPERLNAVFTDAAIIDSSLNKLGEKCVPLLCKKHSFAIIILVSLAVGVKALPHGKKRSNRNATGGKFFTYYFFLPIVI